MYHLDYLCIIGLVLCLTGAYDIPCSPRAGLPGQGQICVCNSTYCDTIERPYKLPRGQYHLYKTSNSTPGFTHTTGSFDTALENDQTYDIMFKINNDLQRQEIIGFGGAFTDSAGIVLNSLPDDAQDKLVESYFGTSGIEYTLCRTPIGGSDFSERAQYTLDDVPYDKDLTNFGLTYEDYTYKIPFMQRAKRASARGVNVYGCAWNSPQWMKTSFLSSHGGAGFLRDEYFQAYAQYHVKYVEEYKKNGVDIWGLSGGNEVLLGFWVGLNCTQELAHMQRVWLKNHLFPALVSANLSHIKYLGMDDMRMFSVYWGDRFVEDPEAFQHHSGVALHWYCDFFTPPKVLDIFHQKYPQQLIVYTESSINPVILRPGDPIVEFGSWGRAALYMHNIIENLSHWTNGYLDWNLALNMDGGPTWANLLDAAVIVNNATGEFYKQPMFYAMGHFSKFIPPGSKIVNTTKYVADNQNPWTLNPSYENLSQFLEILKIYKKYKVDGLSESLLYSAPDWPPIVAPETVECLASSNSDGSYTIIVLNNKNITAKVKIEVADYGTFTLDLEKKSLNSFIYWM